MATDKRRSVGWPEIERAILLRIALTVSEVNRAGVTAYARAGFTREGVLRQACYRDGQYHDKIVMSLLRPEWEARREETTRDS